MVPLLPLLIHAVHHFTMCVRCVVSFGDIGSLLRPPVPGASESDTYVLVAAEKENLTMQGLGSIG